MEHDIFMKKALDQALLAFENNEVPIGAVVVQDGKIIAKAHNQVELLKDATAHAEVLAITTAMQFLGYKYLEECTLYVTVEPCIMCIGSLVNSRVKKVVFAAKEPKTGFSNFVAKLPNKNLEIEQGPLEVECADLMKRFFKGKRKKG